MHMKSPAHIHLDQNSPSRLSMRWVMFPKSLVRVFIRRVDWTIPFQHSRPPMSIPEPALIFKSWQNIDLPLLIKLKYFLIPYCSSEKELNNIWTILKDLIY